MSITELRTAAEALRESEARLRLSVRAANIGLWDWNLITNEVYFSPEWKSQIGYADDELPNRFEEWQSRLHPEDVKGALEKLHAYIATPRGRHKVEFRFRHKDGSYRWIYTKADVLRDATGKPVRMLGCHLDITDRKRDEQAVLRLAAIVESSDDAIVSKDLDGVITSWNHGAECIFGYTEAEAVGRPITILIPPELRNEESLILRRLRTGEHIEHYETVRVTKQGTRVDVSLTISPITNSEGQVVGACKIGHDMIERKRADQELRESQAELARMIRIATMGELTASIAHEINQPMGAVVTNGSAALRWLAGQPSNLEEAREAIERTIREAKRASDVIERIRDLLQKTQPRMERLEVNAVIRDVRALSDNELERGSVTLQTELAADVPAVLGDRVQLQQVMLNLILNGIDAMSTITDRPRELLIKSAKHPDGVLIQVHDSGKGVDPEQADRIFESFFTTKPEGIGMGLSLSRSIVEAHGGGLWFTPRTPHGAIFQFTLPKADGVS